jgi:hypothetical protein
VIRLTPVESQVIGISGLRTVGYTLGRLLFPWFKKKKKKNLTQKFLGVIAQVTHKFLFIIA